MKKWLYPALALAVLGILARLPHPAKDIAKLDPVRAVYLYIDDGTVRIETATGDVGSGVPLAEAAARLKADADKEIFLETAEFRVLDPAVPITGDLFTLLRPGCKVIVSPERPDLKSVSDKYGIHKPALTLAKLRAQAFPVLG